MKITGRVLNILTATTVAAIAVVFGASAQAGSFDYASEVNSVISFDGASHFTFAPSANNLHVSNGSAAGFLGEITGTYTIGAISGNTAPVTGTGTLVIHDGANDLTATLQWVDITGQGTANFLNINGTVNLTNITYAGSNPDLLALKNAGSGINVLSFQFVPAVSLAELRNGPGSHSTSFSGTVAWTACNGTIGDFVWNDLNGNGCQDPGEPGIQGVTVDLYSGCPATTLIQTTTTDSTGHYLFTGLCGGDYSVRFHTPSGGLVHTVPHQACGGTPGDPHNPNDSNCECTGTDDCDVCVNLPPNGNDTTIDCGYNSPPSLPCPAGLFLGGKTTGGSNPGDISIAFDQFPAPNDNSYGTNSIGWGNKGHQFKDLTGSDKAGFQILRPGGAIAVSFNIDYITQSSTNSPPSGYQSLGPFGGDGSIVVNSTPALVNNGTQIQWDTSMARDINGVAVWSPTPTWPVPTYFVGGVQTIGTSGTNSALLTTNSPPVDCSLAPDPSTCIFIYGSPKGSQYPLAVPNPWSASYNNPEYAVVPMGSSQFEAAIARHVDGWNFHDTYFVTFKQAYLTALGFDFSNYEIATYDAATNTYMCPSAGAKWCVAPNPTVLHNSPAKTCPSPTPTPTPAGVVVTTKQLSSKQVKITFQNNTTTAQTITGLSITWPQGTNGNLNNIKFGGTTIYNTVTGGGTLTTSSLLGTTAQRTMNVGASQFLQFNFQNNVDTNASHYTGSATFNPFGNVTILP